MRKKLRIGRPSPAIIVAIVAFIVALGGTAIAAHKIKLGAFSSSAKLQTVGAGPLTYVHKMTSVPTTPFPTVFTVSVSCPAGMRVVGGGIQVDTAMRTVDSYPDGTTGWIGHVANPVDGSSLSAVPFAICATSLSVH